jgi:hypothetical protein
LDSETIRTSGELPFFVVVAARLASLEEEMSPALVPLMTAGTVAAFRSLVGLFMRKPIDGEELRGICSAQGVICGQTNVRFIDGTLCLLVEFDRRTLHVVNYTSFTRTDKNGEIENAFRSCLLSSPLQS